MMVNETAEHPQGERNPEKRCYTSRVRSGRGPINGGWSQKDARIIMIPSNAADMIAWLCCTT